MSLSYLPYKEETIKIGDSSIYGRIGYSVSLDSLFLLCNALYNYCTHTDIYQICIGHDSNTWSESYVKDILVERLLELGLEVFAIKGACPSATVSHFTEKLYTDSKKKVKSLGIYLSTNNYLKEFLEISFKDEGGSPLLEKEIAEIFAMSYELGTINLDSDQDDEPIILNQELFVKDLKQNKNWKIELASNNYLFADLMFGSSETVSEAFKKVFKCPFKSINLASEPVRILNYASDPTGQWLAWKVSDQVKVAKNIPYFGIDGKGQRLGCYDLVENTEISSESTLMCMLFYISKVLKKKGTVAISETASDKAVTVAKSLGFTVYFTDEGISGLKKAVENVDKRSLLAFGDENGNFWFKGDCLDFNPFRAIHLTAAACGHFNLNLGALVDHITEKHLAIVKLYYKEWIPLKEGQEFKSLQHSIATAFQVINEKQVKNGIHLETNDGTTILLVTDPLLKIGKIRIESINDTLLRESVDMLKNSLKTKRELNEKLPKTILHTDSAS